MSDEAGNSASCSFQVSIVDNVPPTIAGCPGNITVNTGPGRATCDQVVTWTAPTASDNCAIAAFSGNYQPGSTFPVGTTTVTYTAIDGWGNSTNCSFNVTVVDTTPPVAPALATLSGACASTVTAPVPTATDNCSGPVTVSPNVPQLVSTPGTNIITWTFEDAAGNTSTASQTVIVSGLNFLGFYAPIGGVNGTCQSPLITKNRGSIIPIKFDLSCGNTSITGGQAPRVKIQAYSNQCVAGAELVSVDAVYQNDWHFNWDTTGWSKGVYKVIVILPDGTSRYAFVKIN